MTGRLPVIATFIALTVWVINCSERVVTPTPISGEGESSVYNGIVLPGSDRAVGQNVPPLAWLIVGDEAVPATQGSYTISYPDENAPKGDSGEVAMILEHADAVAPAENPDLATATLPSNERPVIVVGSGAVQEFTATIADWPDLYGPSERKLQAERAFVGNLAVFTLESIGDRDDRLLAVSITFNRGDASYFWRMNPASASDTDSDLSAVLLEPVVAAARISFLGWSPDGETLAYLEHSQDDLAVLPSFPPGTLKFLDARSGQICDSSIRFPDGQYDRADRLAWLPDEQLLIAADGRLVRGTPCGKDFTPLTDLLPQPIHEILTGSPDGSRILLNGEQTYWLYEPGPQLFRAVKKSVHRDWRNGYAWSPTGDYLAIASVRDLSADLQMTTYVIDAQTGQMKDVIESTLRAGLGGLFDPIWLSEDRFLIQETLDQGPMLVTVGGGVSQVAPDLFGLTSVPSILGPEQVGLYATAAILAGTDTYHLVLAGVGLEANLPSLRLYHSETGKVEELSFRYTGSPAFSPDGRWMILDARLVRESYETTEIWLRPVDPAGGQVHRLVSDVSSSLVWSPGWTRVAIGSPVGGISVFSVPDGAQTGSWRAQDYQLSPLSWSFNSKLLAGHGTLRDGQGEGLFVIAGGAESPDGASDPADFQLNLSATPQEGAAPRRVVLVATLTGGPDNSKELYCAGESWDFGDGMGMHRIPDCLEWTPEARIRRTFRTEYIYEQVGTYQIRLQVGEGEHSLASNVVTIEVR